MVQPVTYLDYNATAPLLPEAEAAVRTCLTCFGNPSSVHQAGRRARVLVEDAREAVAYAVGTKPAQVVFTSGGTESNSLALRGLSHSYSCAAVLAPGTEHASVLAHTGAQSLLAVDRHGVVDLAGLERELASVPAPALVSIMLANNETGVMQPVPEIVGLARTYGAMIHCDAVQAFGKMPLLFSDLGVDSMSLSAHKIGGLKGTGALILRDGLKLNPDLTGGGQERGRRAGTENVLGIAAFGAAVRQMPRLLEGMAKVMSFRDALEEGMLALSSAILIHGRNAMRIGNTSCVTLRGVASETQVMRLDLAGVAVSAGSACSSGKIAPSHVLLAMGVDAGDAGAAIRISLGWNTAADDIARFLEAWRPLTRSAAA